MKTSIENRKDLMILTALVAGILIASFCFFLPQQAIAINSDLQTKIIVSTVANQETISDLSSSSSSIDSSSEESEFVEESSSSEENQESGTSGSADTNRGSNLTSGLAKTGDMTGYIFVIGGTLIVSGLILATGIYMYRKKGNRNWVISTTLIFILISGLGLTAPTLLTANADEMENEKTYNVVVDETKELKNLGLGTINEQILCSVKLSGDFDGDITIIPKINNLLAVDGSVLQASINPSGTPIEFSADEISEGKTKTFCVSILGNGNIVNLWEGVITYEIIESPRPLPEPTIPEGVTGWYQPQGVDNYVFVDGDGSVHKGWLITDQGPLSSLQQSERFWLDPVNGYLARHTPVQTSPTTYAYAHADGTIVRGMYNNGQGSVYIADNDGNLLWGTQQGWVIDNFGNQMQRYYIDPVSHAAKTGFFTVSDDKFYGVDEGYVLRGKMPYDALHVLVANNDGKLLSNEGWVVTAEFDGEFQRYRIDKCYSDAAGNDYYGAHITLFTIDGDLYYGKPGDGYVARNQSFIANDNKCYKADNEGKLTLSPDWALAVAPSGNVPDWGDDPAYTEQMRARAIANGGNQPYYITVDNRAEGGGRVIIFKHDGDSWIALAGWYANVGRWNSSHTMTRSIAGIRPITDKIEQGTTAHNEPWVIPYFTDYLHWIDENGNDDGQGFHYTPNPNQQGNDMAGCTAFAAGRVEQAKWIWANVPLGCYVDVCGVACPDIATWENS